MEAAPRIRTGGKGFAVLCLTTWLCRPICSFWSGRRDSNPRPQPWQGCALPLSYFRTTIASGGETQNRTGDTRIFSPLLYLLSYLAIRETWKMAGLTRLELATSGVTGRHSNRPELQPRVTLNCTRYFILVGRRWVRNQRPPACKAGALPLSYPPRRLNAF